MEQPSGDRPKSTRSSLSKQEVVVITGATAGVGRAVTREFARRGAQIALLARDDERLQATAEEVRGLGGKALPIPVDVADAAAVEDAAARTERELGPIDIWINDAMTTVFGRVMNTTPEEYRRVTEVTYLGFVWGTQAALRRMIPRGRGTVVQVGSALAYRAIPLQASYCGAKHAIRAFTDALRSELIHDGHHGIQLTMVQLPGMNTPQFDWCRSHMPRRAQPVPPIFQPEVAARAIYFAAHHRRREIYVGFPTIKTILGQKLAPGFLDHYLADKVVDGQQTRTPEDPERGDNLFNPLPGRHGAHGRFDERARTHDMITRASCWLGAAGLRTITGVFAASAIAGFTLLSTRALSDGRARHGNRSRRTPPLQGHPLPTPSNTWPSPRGAG